MISEIEYRKKLYELCIKYPKKNGTTKYIRQWDRYFSEKEKIVDLLNLDNVKTALDIGTGVGHLPYLLMKKNIKVDITLPLSILDEPLYVESCNLIGLTPIDLVIKSKKSLNLDKKYDLITAIGTTFDIQEPNFDWDYFFNDCFQFCEQVFIRSNSGRVTPPKIKNFEWFGFVHWGLKWSIYLTKDQFLNKTSI